MNDKIQLKRGTLANWLKADPVLADGEMALVATNPATPNVYDQYKVGGGSKKFSELPYQGLPCLQELGASTTSPLSQKAITDWINKGYQFRGVATPSTNPGTPDGPIFYFATKAGTYPNFGNITVKANQIVALCNIDGSWESYEIARNTIAMDLSRELYGALFDKYNKFTLIGDSISTFAGYIPSNYIAHYPKGKIDSVDKTYWFSLAQKLGCAVQNLSSGGSTVTNKSSLSLPKRAPLVDSDSDLIIIALGANDTNTESNEELNYSKELSDYDESIFTEAYIKGLRIILENNPNSDVLLITMDKPGRNPNNAVATKAIAEHYGVMYLDIRGTYDGELHPDNDTTDDGSEMLNIADAVVDSLISNNNKNGLRNTVAKIRNQISGHIGTYISECKSYKLDNPILLTHDNRLFSADSITIATNEYEFQSVDWYFNYPAIGERIKLTITDRVNGNDAIASFRFYDCEFDGSKVDDSHIITDKTITETGSISLEVPANTKCVVVIFHAAFGTGLAEGTKVVFSDIKIEYETVDVTYVDSKEFVSVKTDAEGKILEGIKMMAPKFLEERLSLLP